MGVLIWDFGVRRYFKMGTGGSWLVLGLLFMYLE